MARRKPGDTKPRDTEPWETKPWVEPPQPCDTESTAIQMLREECPTDDFTVRLWHGLAVVLAKRLEQRDPEWVKHFVDAEYPTLKLTLALHRSQPMLYRALHDLERRPRPKRGERAWDLLALLDQYNWLLAQLQALRRETARISGEEARRVARRKGLEVLCERISHPMGTDEVAPGDPVVPGDVVVPGFRPRRARPRNRPRLPSGEKAWRSPELIALDMLGTLHDLSDATLQRKLLPKLRKQGRSHLAAGKRTLIQIPRR